MMLCRLHVCHGTGLTCPVDVRLVAEAAGSGATHCGDAETTLPTHIDLLNHRLVQRLQEAKNGTNFQRT